MYEVQHRRYYYLNNDFSTIARGFRSLEEAKAAREMSGDLVVESVTDSIVTDKSWLWDWEMNDPTSYAHKAIDWQVNHPIE